MPKVRLILIYAVFIFLPLSVVAAAENSSQNYFSNDYQRSRLISYQHAEPADLDTQLTDNAFLLEIASDTWGYFRDVVDRDNALPLDNIMVFKDHTNPNSYTSVTDVGLYLMCVVCAYDFKFITREEAVDRIQKVVKTLDALPKWEGSFYNYYETITLKNSGLFISSADNGWLVAGLMVAKEAFSEVSDSAEKLVSGVNLGKLYDQYEGQLFLGWEGDKGKFSPYHYGVFYTEPRVASYIAIAKGEAPAQHWFRMYRTMPADWTWQSQVPIIGKEHTYINVTIPESYYEYGKFKYVPSWGGSLFEALMPSLVLKEQELGKKGLARNNKTMVDAQIWYALKEQKYPLWGISPCATPGNMTGYSEYGVSFLGVKGYEDLNVVTPHVSFLALSVRPRQAIKNIRKFAEITGMYGIYGFYDAYNIKKDVVASKYLCLDQAMSLISIDNYLNKGAIRERFHQDPRIKAKEYLLKMEEFF